MKTTAGQALRFAASARPPMRQARRAVTDLNHGAAAREDHRRRPGDLAAPAGRRRRSPLHQVTVVLCHIKATHVGDHVYRPRQREDGAAAILDRPGGRGGAVGARRAGAGRRDERDPERFSRCAASDRYGSADERMTHIPAESVRLTSASASLAPARRWSTSASAASAGWKLPQRPLLARDHLPPPAPPSATRQRPRRADGITGRQDGHDRFGRGHPGPHSPVAVTIAQGESRPARVRMPRGRGRR